MEYHKSFEKFIYKVSESNKYCDYFAKMNDFIENEKNICPLKENVFRFLQCNLNNAKCIILGMDPYSSTYINNDIETPVATGRAFEVGNIEKWTDGTKNTSLTNIFKSLIYQKYNKIFTIAEIRDIIKKEGFKYINMHEWFDEMESQGVIFLNATLTTTMHKSGAHIYIWTDFMNELLNYIVTANQNIKWLIWGESARNRVKGIVDDKNIIYTCHPATRVNNTFVKDCPFSKIKNINWV